MLNYSVAELRITIVYPLILHAVFDVSAQLSLDGDKLWLLFVDLYISEHVVNKAGKCERGFGPDNPNASDKRPMHCSFNETKDVFNAASHYASGSNWHIYPCVTSCYVFVLSSFRHLLLRDSTDSCHCLFLSDCSLQKCYVVWGLQ